jgi:Fe-S-cluster containining protein
MDCRIGCAACCIAPSISSKIPGMPQGKPAGIRCIQLTDDNKCKIFRQKDRPKVCGSLAPSEEMCGKTSEEALIYLKNLEELTSPKKDE